MPETEIPPVTRGDIYCYKMLDNAKYVLYNKHNNMITSNKQEDHTRRINESSMWNKQF